MAIEPTERACAIHERAMALRDAGRPAQARRASMRAVALFEVHAGPRHPDVANALVELAGAAHECGDYDEAIAHARRALSILKPHHGDLDVERVRVGAYSQLGHSHIARGAYGLAEKACISALAVARAKLPPDEVVAQLNGLAIVYKYTARYAEAGRLYKRALLVTERDAGARHLSLATILHNLGGLEHARGRFARAEPYARRGLAIRRRALGDAHPEVAADAAALAAILHGLNRFAEAERLFRAAIATFERSLGKSHFEVGFNVGNLAALCQAKGRVVEADRLYRRAIRIKEKALGREHPDLALTLQNLATLRRESGRSIEAKALTREALGIFRRTLGARHPHTRACAALAAALKED